MVTQSMDSLVETAIDFSSVTNTISAIIAIKARRELLRSDREVLRETAELFGAIDFHDSQVRTPDLVYRVTSRRPLFYETLKRLRAPETVTFASMSETLANVANGRRYDATVLNQAETFLTYLKREYFSLLNQGSGQI